MEPTSLASALATIKMVGETLRLVQESKDLLKDSEARAKLATILEDISEVKGKLYSVTDELYEKNGLIRELQSKLDAKESVVFQAPYYVSKTDPEAKFCQVCMDSKQILVRIQLTGLAYRVRCALCKNDFELQGVPRRGPVTRLDGDYGIY